MGTTDRGLEYPDSTSNFTPSADMQTLAEGVDDLFDGTTGTWTPTAVGFSPALSGTWSGTYRRVGDIVFAEAKITTTADYTVSSWPTDWHLTGLPITVGTCASAMAYQSWGNLPWPAAADGTTLYVHTTSKTATNIPSGSVIRVDGIYLADDD